MSAHESVATGDAAPVLRAEGRTIAKALRSAVEKAHSMGCANPKLFFEPESMSIHVLDGDHPDYVSDTAAPWERTRATVLRIPIGDVGAGFDAGGW